MINLFNSLALGTGRPHQGRAGQGGGHLVGADGHDFRLGRRQRADHRPVHHPADEALRLLRRSSPARSRRPSSMGGQIMPPVMGAVAFIMAENLNVPYADIVKAAAIPAILYYVTAFWMVHLEAGRKGLVGLPKEQCPNPLARHPRPVVPGAAAGRAGLDAVQRLHADVFGHGRPGADRHPDPRRRARRARLGHGLPLRRSGWPSGWPPRSSSAIPWGIEPVLALIAALVAAVARQGRPQDPAPAEDEPRRRRPPGAAGRRRLRRRRRHHRRADADRRRLELRRLHPRRRREEPVPLAGADHDRLPDPRHGHPDHPQLHHHQRHRRAGAAASSACR